MLSRLNNVVKCSGLETKGFFLWLSMRLSRRLGALASDKLVVLARGDVQELLGFNAGQSVLLHEYVRRIPNTVLTQCLSCFPRNALSGEKHRSEEHTSELQSLRHLVCRLL